jgi:hypothetical protein
MSEGNELQDRANEFVRRLAGNANSSTEKLARKLVEKPKRSEMESKRDERRLVDESGQAKLDLFPQVLGKEPKTKE